MKAQNATTPAIDATTPSDAPQLARLTAIAITDARMFLHYFRTTPDSRVLMGSGSGPIGLGGRLDGRFTGDRPTVERAAAGLGE